ncbi:hypothetical protein WOLCODRAFT_138330 [Wolfiporia cocos MD-104 SS10]|uniref:Uncharacterized protein n=1 Tax=Wolfiporia cocos (strain MD-104) TaxID=742152 RepID=A0A2H3K2Z5_WOLCO|nr:hypothetical protein WOLCODRAFT_138330 [Wolfiporia cocos MD-104 SS10]
MPPAKIKSTKPVISNSRELVPVGPREVFAKNPSRLRDANGNKPLTARALVLRNGKYGAWGTGELVLVGKMSGREKLDLLAEDLIEQSKKALGTPFRLEQCIKIADSQLASNLDEINNLQDPDLFATKIRAEVLACTPPVSSKNAPDPFKNPSQVASIVAARVHNAYMMASAWKLITDTFQDLAEAGVQDNTIRAQLKKDASLRSRFLVLYDIVNIVAQAAQTKFALLATTTPHYSQYFKRSQTDDLDDEEYVFDWAGLKSVHKSFIDSIIVELCLPRSEIPRQILYQILHEAIAETPRDAKRFPQALWDAVGDLSVIVQLQEYLENPLLGPDGKIWKEEPRTMPEDYENWVDAQIFSEKASKMYGNFKNIIYPLDKTKSQTVLDNMWKYINLNCQAVSGQDIDNLWQVADVKNRTPQWHAYYMPNASKGLDDDDDDDDFPRLFPAKSANRSDTRVKNGKPLAITSSLADDSDSSMPPLQSVSDSSEDEMEDDWGSSDEDDSDDSEAENGYDTDEEDALRDMLREAMDTMMATPEFFDTKSDNADLDNLAEERKGNPFIKLLGSLRGRMFSSSPTLKTTRRTEPRKPYTAKPGTAPASPRQAPTVKAAAKPTPSPAPTTEASKSHKVTVEAVEDDDDIPTAATKKKKKKPKKKKKSSATTEAASATPDSQQPPSTPVTPAAPVAPAASPASPSPQKTAAPKSSTPKRSSSISSSTTSTALPHMSTTSLPLQQTAQSAHKYMQTEGLTNTKTKVKTRADHANLVPIPEKKGLFSRFSKKQQEKEEEEPSRKGSKFSYFSKLTKKTATYMHQLLGTPEDDKKGIAPMKWEHFLKVMREMGFTYDPSTAGSSVRFDPPDPRDMPITFHKPHPDSTLQPIRLKEISKRLKRHYGWSEEDFFKAAQ